MGTITRLRLVLELRMSGAILLLPHIPSWLAQRQVYLYALLSYYHGPKAGEHANVLRYVVLIRASVPQVLRPYFKYSFKISKLRC